MNSTTGNKDFNARFNSFAAKWGMVASVLLFPFVFENIFATGGLRVNEWNGLMIFCGILLACSAFLFFRRQQAPIGISLIFFSVLLLLSVELATRLSLKIFASNKTLKALNEEGNWSYPARVSFSGHPFLQFTGKPSAVLEGNKALGDLPPFNNFGFIGPDFHYEKPRDVIRIACLGESTTADGYPAVLESYLNKFSAGKKIRYEVMNFGQAYWTTDHTLVNFMLNVLDFNPDYIVIHHGWNEEKIRNTLPGEFRGDYSHAFKLFGAPDVPDRLPIRLSVIYRMIKFSYDKAPAWASLGGSVQVQRKESDAQYNNLDELKPYRRNLENIIRVAIQRNIKVVMTTLPHSTDPKIPMYYGYKSIDQCNAINREVVQEFHDAIFFVDLDSLITGHHNEIFKDLGHINDAGRLLKSEAIGNVIAKQTELSPDAGH